MSKRLLTASIVSLVLAAWGCETASDPTDPTPSLTGLALSGNGSFTNRNDTSQLGATANFSGGTTQDVTNSATWTTSNAAVASVTSTGLVTALTNGSATITAAYQGLSGSLAVLVTLRATATASGNFQRLCGPFRARLEVTFAETGRSIGYNITSVTLTMRDLSGNVKATRTYSAADLVTNMGASRIEANSSRILVYEASYSPVVDTEDSSASISMTITDDAGNTQTINVGPVNQHDRC